MSDFMACSTCANCVKHRRGWTCRLGNSTRGGRWSARFGEWTKKGEKDKKKETDNNGTE